MRASGRWHTAGRPIVYCAPNPATALLEVLVHTCDLEDVPVRFRYLEIDAPDDSSIETVDVNALGRNWQENLEASRRAGDQWLYAGRAVILRVPSVIVPATWNLLINPHHPESSRVRIVRVHRRSIDVRLAR